MEFFNFGLEQKLDRHSCVAIPMVMVSTSQNPPKCRLGMVPQKMKFFNFGLEQKLDQPSCVKFHGDSDGNCFKAKNR